MNRFTSKARKSRGFTLVELLIVIIIIGILAGAMLLVAGSSTDKANATKIVSNLRTLKSACLLRYADQTTWPTSASTVTTELAKYIDRDLGAAAGLAYVFVDGAGAPTDAGELFIQATLSAPYDATGVQNALAAMADDSGLYQGTAATAKYAGGTTVLMVVK